jgi:hypothetical protein
MHIGAHFGLDATGPAPTQPVFEPSGNGVDWDPAQDAICDWVEATSGLPLGHAYWADQDGVRNVPAPYVVMRLLNTDHLGRDQLRHEVDEDDDDTITAFVEGPRILRVTLTVFSDDVVGPNQPMSILNRIFAGRSLPSIFEALVAANIAIGTPQSVVNIPGVEAFEARATAQFDVTVQSMMSEPGFVIRTVKFRVQEDTTGFDTTVTMTAP